MSALDNKINAADVFGEFDAKIKDIDIAFYIAKGGNDVVKLSELAEVKLHLAELKLNIINLLIS